MNIFFKKMLKKTIAHIIFTVLFFIFCTETILADAENKALQTFLHNDVTELANISLLFRNVTTGEDILSYRSHSVVPPASTMKVLTTATAIDLLGGDFQFSTYLETDGEIDGSVLRGNLYIRGTGDPTLGSAHVGNRNFLTTWVTVLKSLGITRIAGRVIADASFYETEAINPQWIWEDIGNYYAPGIYAIPYLDNTINITLEMGAVGTRPVVKNTIPAIEGLQFDNFLVCTANNAEGAYVHGLPFSNHRYLTGTVAANSGLTGIRGDIPNPALLLAQHLTKKLREFGVSVDSSASYVLLPTSSSRTVLYEHKSPALRDILYETNQHSNNLYAEQIFKYLGSRMSIPATAQKAAEFISHYWANRGVNLSGNFICDGSGLSPQDAISAKVFVDLLTNMMSRKSYTDFYASLPVSGKTGTLKGFCCNTELEGIVHAKSGTTSRIKAYAGYMKLANNHTVVFAVLVNNGAAKSKVVQGKIQNLLLDVYRESK